MRMRFAIALGLVAFGVCAVPADSQRPVQPVGPVPAVWASPGWLGISHAQQPPRQNWTRGPHLPVVAVHPDSPAARAGLQPGDTIVRLNGQSEVTAQMRALRLQPGDTVRLRVRRAGQRDRDVTLVAVERPSNVALAGVARAARPVGSGDRVFILNDDTIRIPVDSLVQQVEVLRRRMIDIFEDSLAPRLRQFEAEVWPQLRGSFQSLDTLRHRLPTTVWLDFGGRGIAGAEMSDLNPELASFFDGATEGVLVLRVAPESPAARAGLRAGDVVTTVDGSAVRTLAELRQTLARRVDRPTDLEVIRRGRTVQLRLP